MAAEIIESAWYGTWWMEQAFEYRLQGCLYIHCNPASPSTMLLVLELGCDITISKIGTYCGQHVPQREVFLRILMDRGLQR